MMNDVLDYYFNELNLDIEEARDRALDVYGNPNRTRTFAKEMIGEALIEKYKLFEKFANKVLRQPLKSVVKIGDRESQLKGIDYIINGVKIDLKSCVGPDYRECPLEISQNGVLSYENKETDYLLYILADWNGVKLCPVAFPAYKKIISEVKEDQIRTSFNGTGKYCKHYIEPIWQLLKSEKALINGARLFAKS